MKTNFKFYLLMMVIPMVLFSCGGRGKRASQNDADSTRMAGTDTTGIIADTTMRGGVMQEAEGDFIMDAASEGLMEVELGQYAEKNAQHPRVKKFAAMMVKNHSKANDELKALAAKKNVQFPSSMNDRHHDKMTDLQKKQGTEFDKEYIDAMVKNHEKDTDRFKREAEKNQDPDLKSWAAKMLPVLLMHLNSAKAIQNALNR